LARPRCYHATDMPSRPAQTTPEIVVLGDINVDLIALTRSWPRPGEECLADHLELHCGGVGANCALALRKWGVVPQLIASVGRDPLGDTVLARLAAKSIEVRHIQRTVQATTGLLYINVTPDGQRTFFGSRGANSLLRPQPPRSPLLKRVRVASLMGYSFLDPGPEKAAGQILRAVRRNRGWASLDVGMEPSQKIPRKILQILNRIDLLFVSNEEASALTGQRNARKAFRRLQRAGAREIVMKLGRRGCLLVECGKLRNVPGFKVRSVDSTGAGDAFTAALLQARLRSWPPTEAALVANAAGAVAASVVGAGDSALGVKEIVKLMRSQSLAHKWEAARLRVLRRLSNLA
jgi:ribokinase